MFFSLHFGAQVSQVAKIFFLGSHFPIAPLERSFSADKTLQKRHTLIFCFLKVIEVCKFLKSWVCLVLLSKKMQKLNVFVT